MFLYRSMQLAGIVFQACSFRKVSGSGDGCTTGVRKPPHDKSHNGSICGVGWRFQSFKINDLEMVDLTGIEPVTS